MLLVELLVVAVIVVAVVLVARGRGGALAPAPPDADGIGIDREGPLAAADVDKVRFGLAFRGYRMAEVDFVLTRLADQLGERDEELARLRRAPGLPHGLPGTEDGSGDRPGRTEQPSTYRDQATDPALRAPGVAGG